MTWIKSARPRVLLTGSSGRIGTFFTKYSQGKDYDLVGLDLNPPKLASGLVEFFQGDIQDTDLLSRAMEGCSVIAHLAAHVKDVDKSDFMNDVLPNNIIGTYRIYEMATKHMIHKIIFTSSVQTMDGYGQQHVKVTDRPHPTNFYGISKVTGEDIGLVFSKRGGPASVNLRLGWVETDEDREEIRNSPDSWWLFLSELDCNEILRTSIMNDISEKFLILDAMSLNASNFRELNRLGQYLGYTPQSDANKMFGDSQATWVK